MFAASSGAAWFLDARAFVRDAKASAFDAARLFTNVKHARLLWFSIHFLRIL